jgi:hypothetical protein
LLPEHVDRFALSNDADRIYAGLFTFHRSGFIREAALRLIVSDDSPVVVPFILMRLVDWVEPVRLLAEVTIRDRLIAKYAGAVARCLALMERLERGLRFRSEYSSWIENFLKRPECAAALMRHLSRSLKAYQLALDSPAISAREVIEQGIDSPAVVVRKWAILTALERLPESREKWLRRAAMDSYRPIRAIAFESAKESFLLDRSASIRRASQAASALPARLRDGVPADLDVAILGLAETGDGNDRALIAPLIKHTNARVRRAVIRASAAERSSLFALIATDVTSVAREAALYLIPRGECGWRS